MQLSLLGILTPYPWPIAQLQQYVHLHLQNLKGFDC